MVDIVIGKTLNANEVFLDAVVDKENRFMRFSLYESFINQVTKEYRDKLIEVDGMRSRHDGLL